MTGVSRIGIDTAGSTILGPGGFNVKVNGFPCSTLGDDVAAHGPPIPHNSAKMVTASQTVFANGKPVVRAGDLASCGHTATGSHNVFAG